MKDVIYQEETGQRKLGSEVVEKDCRARHLHKEDAAMDRRKRRNLINYVVS